MECRQRQEHDVRANAGRGRARSGRLGFAALVAASIWTLLAVGAAQASTITVGSVLPTSFSSAKFGQVETLFNTALPEKGANLVSPVNGAIVRWRMVGGVGGPFYLRVLRPNGSGAYQAVGTSGGATPSGPGLQTFTANIPVHSGDLIGVDPTGANDEIGIATVAGSSFGSIFPPPLEGATLAPSASKSGEEIELSAEVQPAPAITAVSPHFGSIAGGETVVITGTNLGGASAVKFGTTPATSFTAESETQITAVAPPNAKPGRVDVAATTLAGTSPTTGADRFAYTACVVPRLKNKKLPAAKTALRRANCKLGLVAGRKTKSATVVKQTPKPGKVLVPGAKVSVKTQG